jgi:hypothetical protein
LYASNFRFAISDAFRLKSLSFAFARFKDCQIWIGSMEQRSRNYTNKGITWLPRGSFEGIDIRLAPRLSQMSAYEQRVVLDSMKNRFSADGEPWRRIDEAPPLDDDDVQPIRLQPRLHPMARARSKRVQIELQELLQVYRFGNDRVAAKFRGRLVTHAARTDELYRKIEQRFGVSWYHHVDIKQFQVIGGHLAPSPANIRLALQHTRQRNVSVSQYGAELMKELKRPQDPNFLPPV